MSRRKVLNKADNVINAATLDGEYKRRGLIRPSQFKKIHAEKQAEYSTVSFNWKGTRVHGFKPLVETIFEDLIDYDPHAQHRLEGHAIGQQLADDR